MLDVKIFSADSHVSEPGDLWLKRIDKDFLFRAPRMETRERMGKMEDFFVYEGFPPHPVAVGLGAAARQGAARNGEINGTFREERKGYGDARPGGWDPVERLKDQDVDGVIGEVLHTTLAFRLYWMKDGDLQRACFRAYNDWLAEFCSHSPKRLIGVPLISVYDIDEAVKEIRRSDKLGLKGAMMPLSPPATCPPYWTNAYDPIWAVAQELDIPLVFHEITGGGFESPLSPSSHWNPEFTLGMLIRPHEVQRTLGQLILGGVLERFPTIKIISAENGTDWLPWYTARLDRAARGPFSYPTKLSLKPIEYFHRQVYFTYINEPHAVGYRDLIGGDHKLLFATDYPHSASPWPESMKVVDRDTADLPPDVTRKLIHDNLMKVFNVPEPVAV